MLLSQIELSKLLGVSFALVNRRETGKFAPTMKAKRILQPLFEKYDIKVEE